MLNGMCTVILGLYYRLIAACMGAIGSSLFHLLTELSTSTALRKGQQQWRLCFEQYDLEMETIRGVATNAPSVPLSSPLLVWMDGWLPLQYFQVAHLRLQVNASQR